MPDIHDEQNMKIHLKIRSLTVLYFAISVTEAKENQSVLRFGAPHPLTFCKCFPHCFLTQALTLYHIWEGMGMIRDKTRWPKIGRFKSGFQMLDLRSPLKGRIYSSPEVKV